mmetsp:Transcript_58365/g.115848  ORF Transcript_58365/g.115848 Transcript_58365/m.115848 type:complete len:84 (+) Transcript_58365:2866-3117(+)
MLRPTSQESGESAFEHAHLLANRLLAAVRHHHNEAPCGMDRAGQATKCNDNCNGRSQGLLCTWKALQPLLVDANLVGKQQFHG